MRSPTALLISLSLLAACNPDVEQTSGTGTTPLHRGEVTASDELVEPVVIGEAGPRFDACQATGIVQPVSGNGRLAVRAAPFTEAAQRDTLISGDRVFICNRSHDQDWFGVIYNDARDLSGVCGVSSPVSRRIRYDGPCASGWVASAFIRLRATR